MNVQCRLHRNYKAWLSVKGKGPLQLRRVREIQVRVADVIKVCCHGDRGAEDTSLCISNTIGAEKFSQQPAAVRPSAAVDDSGAKWDLCVQCGRKQPIGHQTHSMELNLDIDTKKARHNRGKLGVVVVGVDVAVDCARSHAVHCDFVYNFSLTAWTSDTSLVLHFQGSLCTVVAVHSLRSLESAELYVFITQ